MKYPYVVILKKTGQRATDALSVLLCFISIGVFALLGLHSFRYEGLPGSSGKGRAFRPATGGLHDFAGNGWTLGATTDGWLISAIALVLLIGLVLILLARRRGRPGKMRFRYLLLLAAMGWMFFTTAPWVGILFLLLVFLEYQTRRPLEIGFDYDRVVINTLIRQQFDWRAFNNVILKDGLLTLDFKSNRLIQREVADDDEGDDADEEEFNAWCRTRLAAVAAGSIQER
ncbi:MAG TPA: hypothetical protein VNW04_20450 [Puia sp.]|nr:hypothetical protein [Puia sp.]